MATIRQPVDSQPLVEPELRFIGTRTWLNFFRLVARLLESLREVPVIATADVTPAAAATADGVPATANPAPSAVSVTSANATAAGAGYVQATATTWVTLLNELKPDLNQLVTDVNAVVTQGDLMVTEFNALVTQFDALVTQVNVINTQLTATIALVNEIKASQNAQSIALNS